MLTITVSRTSGADCSATVDFATSDGTAAGGSDYAPVSGTLTFAAGVISQSFGVAIAADALFEGDETFAVTLSNPLGGAVLGTSMTSTVTIVEDDAAPTLSIDSISLAEGDAGTTNFVFTVTLTGSTALASTVDYATADGTANAGSDYTATGGTLTFNPGETTQDMTVQVSGDTTLEPDQVFALNLSSPANAVIATATGVGTITNDDAGADLRITKTGNGDFLVGQTGTFTIVVVNDGPDEATAVTVTDVLPTGMSFVAASATQGTCSGTTTVVCNLGAISNGGSASITLTVSRESVGPLSNTASVSATPHSDPNPGNDSSTAAVSGIAAVPALDDTMLVILLTLLGGMALFAIPRR